MENTQQVSVQDLLSQVISGTGAGVPAKKEAPFISYTVYINEHYVGNFSLPENFTEGTKDAVLSAMKALGLELRAPGSTKRELTMTDLGIKAQA